MASLGRLASQPSHHGSNRRKFLSGRVVFALERCLLTLVGSPWMIDAYFATEGYALGPVPPSPTGRSISISFSAEDS